MVSPSPLRPGSGGSAGTTVGPGAWALGLLAGLLALGGWQLWPGDAGPARRLAEPPTASTGPGLTSGKWPAAAASAVQPVSQAPPEALGVRVLALRRDSRGRWLARLRVDEEPPRMAQVGDVIARGLRVEKIAPDGLLLRRGLRLEPLAFAGRVEVDPEPPPSQRAPPPSVIVSPPGTEAPHSNGVDRAIQRATWQTATGTGH